jgi:hypothetical protein
MPKIPKWPLYPEFAFLDFYVDQTLPRHYQLENNNDTESVHSTDNQQESEMNGLNVSVNGTNDNEEADQSSPSSSSSTPSTTVPPPIQSNISVLQLFQRIIQSTDTINNRWSAENNLINGASENNNLLLSELIYRSQIKLLYF